LKKLISHILLILLFCSNGISQRAELAIELDKLIRYDTEINFKKTPGFIVGIIDQDSSYTFSFGVKEKLTKNLLSETDIFEIGSVTKVFTASLVNILSSEGLLSLDQKVNDFIELEYKNPRLADLTLHDLINHQSGLPKRPSFFGKKEKNIQNPYEFYSKQDLLLFYRDYIPDDKEFEYSHTNYALLELVIEKVTGKLFGDVLNEKIFDPIKMESSFIDLPEQKNDIITPGYNRAEKFTQPWIFSSFRASDGMKTSMVDMIQFIKTNLGITQNELSKTLVDGFSKGQESSFNTQLAIVNGWHSIHMNKFDIITHSGKTSGHNVFVSMVRETKTGVIVFANSSIGTEDLGLQILRMINYGWKRIK
jgi:CubicO group peptidase (beta-lactamase class C family)